jgi:hypothetical protein
MMLLLSEGLLQTVATRGKELGNFPCGSFFTFFALLGTCSASVRPHHSEEFGPVKGEIGWCLDNHNHVNCVTD